MLQFFLLFATAFVLLVAFSVFLAEKRSPGIVREVYAFLERNGRKRIKKRVPKDLQFHPAYVVAYYQIFGTEVYATLPPPRLNTINADVAAQRLSKAVNKMQELLISYDQRFLPQHCTIRWEQAKAPAYEMHISLALPIARKDGKVHMEWKRMTLAPNQVLALSRNLREFYRILEV